MKEQLAREEALLHVVDLKYNIPAATAIRQLRSWYDQPLPDKLPEKFVWVNFVWPRSGEIDLTKYWKEIDARWTKPYL